MYVCGLLVYFWWKLEEEAGIVPHMRKSRILIIVHFPYLVLVPGYLMTLIYSELRQFVLGLHSFSISEIG